MEAEWLKHKHLGLLGDMAEHAGPKVMALGPHGRPYVRDAVEQAREVVEDVWAQVVPQTDGEKMVGMERERIAKGGHGVPLSGMSHVVTLSASPTIVDDSTKATYSCCAYTARMNELTVQTT